MAIRFFDDIKIVFGDDTPIGPEIVQVNCDASTPFIGDLAPLRIQAEDYDETSGDDYTTYISLALDNYAFYATNISDYASVKAYVRATGNPGYLIVGDGQDNEWTNAARAYVDSASWYEATLTDFSGTIAAITDTWGFYASVYGEYSVDLDWIEFYNGTGPTANIVATLTASARVIPPKISTFNENFEGDWSKWSSYGSSTISGGKATIDGTALTGLIGS